jgi:hypothetical protein
VFILISEKQNTLYKPLNPSKYCILNGLSESTITRKKRMELMLTTQKTSIHQSVTRKPTVVQPMERNRFFEKWFVDWSTMRIQGKGGRNHFQDLIQWN